MKYKEAYTSAQKDKRMSKVTPDYLEWKKEGMFIVGQFVGVSAVASSRGEGSYNQYLFHTDDGLVKFAVGSATDKEIVPLIKQGEVYHIQYLGKEKLDKTRSVNKFMVHHVELSEDELRELDSIDFTSAPDSAVVGGEADKPF